MSATPLIDSRPVWIEPEPIPRHARWNILDSNPLVSAILYRRGVRDPEEARRFMNPADGRLPSPADLPDVGAAVQRISTAIANGETVAIFGDYDADGITSTAILASALLTHLPPENVISRLPRREEGYGLNLAAIGEFRDAGASLVIATDCASTDHIHAAHVLDDGMDLIIVDHHHMAGPGPDQAITISPQLGSIPAMHDLTAAGVAYLLVAALAASGLDVSPTFGADPRPYLDLVALGTVADVAPLDGINRTLVALGIQAIRNGTRPGINALVAEARLDREKVTAENIAFALAPRLNAPGRMGDPHVALDLLLAPGIAAARPLAARLEEINRQRKTRSTQIHAEAWSLFCQTPGWESQAVVAVHSPRWEPGLVGAVASRLVDEVRRPVLLFHEDGDVLHGSARSVQGINLMAALETSEPILRRYGGHSLAAGLSLDTSHLSDLQAHLTTAIEKLDVPIPAPHELHIDATLPPDYLTLQTVRELDRMEPFGRGNSSPLLVIRGAELLRYSTLGSDNRHLKLYIRGRGRQLEAVFWDAAWRSKELVGQRSIDLVGHLTINRWNGNERLQMDVQDFRLA